MASRFVTSTPRAKLRELLWSVAFLVLYLVVSSRGLMEMYVGQLVAYGVQAVAAGTLMLGTVIACVEARNGSMILRVRSSTDLRRSGLSLGGFMIALLVSSLVTLWTSGFTYFWLYDGIMTFYATFMFVTSIAARSVWQSANLGVGLSVVFLILLAVATWEQLTGVGLPGHAWYHGVVRPASLTGSKQHYALLVSMLAVVFLEVFVQTRKSWYLTMSALATLASAFSLTRQGPMIIGLAAAMAFALYVLAGKTRWVLRLAVLFILVGVSVAFLVLQDSLVAERILSSVDPTAPGNPGRIASWTRGVQVWLSGPILIGALTGLVTQSTGKVFAGAASFHVESGVLQQLINFGLVGAAFFYMLLWCVYKAINRQHVWLRALVFACAVQSFVYMSIEVIPFMVTVALLPIISQWIDRVGRARP